MALLRWFFLSWRVCGVSAVGAGYEDDPLCASALSEQGSDRTIRHSALASSLGDALRREREKESTQIANVVAEEDGGPPAAHPPTRQTDANKTAAHPGRMGGLLSNVTLPRSFGNLSLYSSLFEAKSSRAPPFVRAASKALRSCACCVMIVSALAMVWTCLRKRIAAYCEECGGIRLKPAGEYTAFRVLICIHHLTGVDADAEFTVWALTRPSGKGAEKPGSSALDETRLEDGVPLAAHTPPSPTWPALLEIMLPPRRPELQLALYTKPGRYATAKYVGCVAIDVQEALATNPEKQQVQRQFSVKSERGRDRGSLVVSFYREGQTTKRFGRWTHDRMPLAQTCALDQALERCRLRTLDSRISKAEILAEMLGGNFLVCNKSGVFIPRYFYMTQKKGKWFWVWHDNPHRTWPAPLLTDSENPRKGFLPVRSIVNAYVLQNDRQGFLVRFKRGDQSLEEMVLARMDRENSKGGVVSFADAVRGRDELLYALRTLRDEALHSTPEGSDLESPDLDDNESVHSGYSVASDARLTERSSSPSRLTSSLSGRGGSLPAGRGMDASKRSSIANTMPSTRSTLQLPGQEPLVSPRGRAEERRETEKKEKKRKSTSRDPPDTRSSGRSRDAQEAPSGTAEVSPRPSARRPGSSDGRSAG